MEHSAFFWVGFHLLIALLLGLDLGVFHRKGYKISFRMALISSVFWIAAGLLFNLFVYLSFGPLSALQFFTGYLIEKSLSVDNLFLFLLIFLHFQVPAAYQRKVLFWGILGAIVFRISLILIGIALIERFYWMFYVFGAFLLLSGIKFALEKKEFGEVSRSSLYKFLCNIFPVSKGDSKGVFFVRVQKKWKVTSLFLALAIIECTDIIFALDSIPAVFAITMDAFIVYTSNIFAILGLRSLYFLLASSLAKLAYIKFGLAAILIFIGAKMLLSTMMPISLLVSLVVIVAILAITILISLKKA